MSRPEEWVGLGFVATIENAPGEWMAGIEGIEAVAAQIAWGLQEQKPSLMAAYLDDLEQHGLTPVGWGWCDATDQAGAAEEGEVHARLALDLGLQHYIANMEEPYDAHGDSTHSRFHMPDAYCQEFRQVAPDIEFAVTTTPRWASNHAALRSAGAVHMPQAFPLENGASVHSVCEFAHDWGWTMDRVRPLCQVYETNEEVPPAKPFLDESLAWGVGLVPYILEQALGGEGRTLLTALVPAISRQPTGGGDDVAEPLPGLAADQCAEYETRDMKRDDGKDATSWRDRATGLKAMRTRVMELEARIEALEASVVREDT